MTPWPPMPARAVLVAGRERRRGTPRGQGRDCHRSRVRTGRGDCLAFVAEGATTYLLDVTDAVEAKSTNLVRRLPPARSASRPATCASLAEAVVLADRGRIDVMTNNAGIHGEIAQLGALSEEGFDNLVAVNFKGVFLGMREVLPVMAERGGGSVVNTSSIAGSRGVAPRTVVTRPPRPR